MQLNHIGNSSQLLVVACLVHVKVMLCHLVQHGCFHDLRMIIVETSIDVPTLGMVTMSYVLPHLIDFKLIEMSVQAASTLPSR